MQSFSQKGQNSVLVIITVCASDDNLEEIHSQNGLKFVKEISSFLFFAIESRLSKISIVKFSSFEKLRILKMRLIVAVRRDVVRISRNVSMTSFSDSDLQRCDKDDDI